MTLTRGERRRAITDKRGGTTKRIEPLKPIRTKGTITFEKFQRVTSRKTQIGERIQPWRWAQRELWTAIAHIDGGSR